jgi:hypothetical protein
VFVDSHAYYARVEPWRPCKVRLIKQIFDTRIYSWGGEFEFELAMIGEEKLELEHQRVTPLTEITYLDCLFCR